MGWTVSLSGIHELNSAVRSISCSSCAAVRDAVRAQPLCFSSFIDHSNLQVGRIVAARKLRRVGSQTGKDFVSRILRARSDNAEVSDYETDGAFTTRPTQVQDGLVDNSGESSLPRAVAIQKLGLNLRSERGDVPVLRDCSLNVPEGQLWMLLGPNGCGKSTLLKAMAGLLKPNAGKMFVIGPRSFVFQNPDHQVVMPTAEADVAFGLGRFDLPIDEVRERVHKSLKAVGMDQYAQRPVQTLSGGQKQRIAIAGALAESSRLLLLDELTTYLDRDDQIGVLEAVRSVVGVPQKVTALWVTHRLEELEYADGAAYMENGRVILSGSVAEVEAYIKLKQDELFNRKDSVR
ncbi:hypothetical protein R1flu_001887 [Riccia fluitans]|uniref:ABC transporter domain-containing protein n=1 Tax=Riccia fluitans TaxID=41844 RepID=A0ABD1Y7I9_9MARC